ncbi:DUF4345 domain-containing protein [Streptomyces sp. NPDC001193]
MVGRDYGHTAAMDGRDGGGDECSAAAAMRSGSIRRKVARSARQRPIPASAIRWLAGVLLLGGVGRVLSLAVHGWPHWFQIALAALELGLPPVFFRLADAEERAARGGVQAVPAG